MKDPAYTVGGEDTPSSGLRFQNRLPCTLISSSAGTLSALLSRMRVCGRGGGGGKVKLVLDNQMFGLKIALVWVRI